MAIKEFLPNPRPAPDIPDIITKNSVLIHISGGKPDPVHVVVLDPDKDDVGRDIDENSWDEFWGLRVITCSRFISTDFWGVVGEPLGFYLVGTNTVTAFYDTLSRRAYLEAAGSTVNPESPTTLGAFRFVVLHEIAHALIDGEEGTSGPRSGFVDLNAEFIIDDLRKIQERSRVTTETYNLY